MRGLGWLTTGGARGTRVFMIDSFAEALRTLETHDIDLIHQSRGMRRVGLTVQSRISDDLLFSAMVVAATQEPYDSSYGFTGKSGWEW